MLLRIHFLFLVLLFSLFSVSTLAQQKVSIEIVDEQNQVKYAGTFDFVITSKRMVTKSKEQYSIVFEKGDREPFINFFINNLKWSKGNGDLVFKKNWVKDKSNVFKPLNSCIPIQVGGKGSMDFNVLKNGTTTVTIPYAIIPKNTNCNSAELNAFNKGSFTINFDIKGVATKSNDGLKSKEEKEWNNCVEKRSPIICLKAYLNEFPNGQHANKAKQQINYAAVKDYFPTIEKLNRPGQERSVKKSCEDFLVIFPSFVDPYKSVQEILEKANKVLLLEEPENSKSDLANNIDEESQSGKTQDSRPLFVQAPASNSSKEKTVEQPEKQPEEIAWEKAVADYDNPCKAFKVYLSNKEYQKYRLKAEREIASRCNISVSKKEQSGNHYVFSLDNVIVLSVDSIVPSVDSSVWVLKKGMDDYSSEFVIDFPDERNYRVYFSDQHFRNYIRKGSIPIGNLLDPEVLFSGDSILFTFKKGTKPFTVYFQQDGGALSFDTLTNSNVLLLRSSFLKKEKKLSGKYNVLVSDKVLNVPYTEEAWTINIAQDLQLMKYLIPIGCLLLIALLYAYMRFQNKKRKEKKSELESVMKSHKQPMKSMTLSPKKKGKDLSWKSQEQINIQGKAKTSYITNTSSGERKIKKNKEIKITGMRRSSKKVFHYKEDSELLPIIEDSVFCFEPHSLWPNSIIESIYFTKNCLLKLDHFLVSQNLKLIEEHAEAIPEIGGILVGRPNLSAKDGKYRIMVQEFVPIIAEFHSVFQLEFSTESLAKDLGDIQDQFPDYIAVGWFHTHPGHGLFLSKPDLTIQERFFGEPYQFAMEIDSLSEKLDTAIFTRTEDGVINNTSNKKESSEWFSWSEEVTALNE